MDETVRKGWTKWATLMGGMASIALLVTTLWDPGLGNRGSDAESDPAGDYQFQPWEGEPRASGSATEKIVLPEAQAHWIQFVTDGDDEDGGFVEAQVLLSAPGMWPFVSTETKPGGFLSLPAHEVKTLDGRSIQMYEVLARTAEGTGSPAGFWGLVRGPEEPVHADEALQVRMSPGRPIALEVQDEEGNPIEGAYVRLSRDSVGLVHLNYTTRADGRARFRAIPPGTYYLTIDADGHRRTTARVQHGKAVAEPFAVTMEDGGGLRIPHAWRGPPVPEMAAASSSTRRSTTGEAEIAPDGEDESSAARVQVDVLVADPYGAGVEGAWIEAWSQGRRVSQTRSRGRVPVSIDVPAKAPVEVIATHAGWGEGQMRIVDPDATDDVTVGLDSSLLSRTGARDRILWIDEIESALGVELIEDRNRLLIELEEPRGPASEAGIQRGDALLFVRRQGAGYVVVAERSGQLVEVSLP